MNILSILLKLTKWLISYWTARNEELSNELETALREREDFVRRKNELNKQIEYLEDESIGKNTYLIELELDLQETRNEITRIQTERITAIKEKQKLIDEQSDEEVLRGEL